MLHNYPQVQITFKEKLENDIILSPAEALNVFRIMQEALQNALKHAAPTQIDIFISSDRSIQFNLKDNGNGFDVNTVSNGNGLLNINHRANESGYKLEIRSNELGTEISLKK